MTGARHLGRALALGAVLLASAADVQAQEAVAVRLDGRAVFRVVADDTLSATARALRVESRLARVLEREGDVGSVRVTRGPGAGERTVSVGGVPVATTTPADAEWHVSTVDALAAQWAEALAEQLGAAAARRTSPARRLAAEVQGSVQGAFARLLDSAIAVVPRALAALLVLVLFGLLARGVRVAMRALFSRVVDDLTVENLVTQVAAFVLWSVGFIVALGALGLDPETAVAGLGLTSLALGFALKDILSNFVAGLLLLGLRPFRIGDQISVGETEGAVERVTLRATEVRTFDGSLVMVPNGDIFTARVTNNTASPVRRGTVLLHLDYDTDLRRAVEAIRSATQAAEGVLASPPAGVRVTDLGPNDVTLQIRFWADSRRSDFVETASAVRGAAVDALRAEGLPLPNPNLRVVRDAPDA